MQASHESHAVELQTVQSQMLQLQEAVASSSVGSMQRLQEVKMSLCTCKMVMSENKLLVVANYNFFCLYAVLYYINFVN